MSVNGTIRPAAPNVAAMLEFMVRLKQAGIALWFFKNLSLVVPQPVAGVLDAAQHFIAGHALIAECKDGAAFLPEPLVREASGQVLTPPDDRRRSRVRFTANFLRFVAILQILTTGIVLMPMSWVAEVHVWAGLGPLPDDPFLRYVVRGAAYCQGGIGVLLWIMATDVVRYRPLVIATGAIYLVGGPAFYFIDALAGMPRWWGIMDGVSCFVIGAVLLALCRRFSSSDSQANPPVAPVSRR